MASCVTFRCEEVTHCPKFDVLGLDVKYSSESDENSAMVELGTIAKLKCLSGETYGLAYILD